MTRGKAGGQAAPEDMMDVSFKSRFMNADKSYRGNGFPSLDKIKMNSKKAFVRKV